MASALWAPRVKENDRLDELARAASTGKGQLVEELTRAAVVAGGGDAVVHIPCEGRGLRAGRAMGCSVPASQYELAGLADAAASAGP